MLDRLRRVGADVVLRVKKLRLLGKEVSLSLSLGLLYSIRRHLSELIVGPLISLNNWVNGISRGLLDRRLRRKRVSEGICE